MWNELVARYGTEMEMVVVDRDDPEGREFAESYRIGYQPGFVIIDPEGEVFYAQLGPYDPDELRTLIASAAEL